MSVVVIGTGRLAVALTTASVYRRRPMRLVVVGRRAQAAEDVAVTATMRARLVDSPVTVEPVESPLATVDDVVGLLDDHDAELVVCCASRQSPWEGDTKPSAWTSLLVDTGIGGGLALQADLAATVARAAAAGRRPVPIVNAAYPDAVNPLIAAAGAPVLAGAGNAQVTHLALAAALDVPDSRLAVVAHHRHLFGGADDDALAWLDGVPVADVGSLLAAQRRAPRREVNSVTGAAAARLVEALTTGPEFDTSLPGVRGLPGGYPVRVSPGSVVCRLPAGVERAEMIAANRRWAAAEGATVGADGTVRFGSAVTAALAPHVGAELAEGFRAGDLDAVVREFTALRCRLRCQRAQERTG